MLRSITIENMKGQTVTQELTGLDIFTGRNGAGKTTRIQAVGLSILGYVPEKGKTAADTFKLATGDCMTVGLMTNDFHFSRSFNKKEKLDTKSGITTVKISESVSVSPGKGERTDTDKKARIATEIGSFPVMMDFNEFLSLSDAKRRDFIYSLSQISSDTWTREKVQEYLLSNLITTELEQNNIEHLQLVRETINEAIKQFPNGFGIHDGLQSMLDWVSTQLSYWNGKKKDAQGAVRQMSEMKNELVETERNISDNKKELEELQQQLIDVEKKISQDIEKKKAIDNRLNRIKELTASINQLKSEPVDTDTSEIDKKIEELQSLITPEDDQYQAKLETLKSIMVSSKQRYIELEKEANGLKEQMMQMRAGLSTLESSLNSINELGGSCVIDKRIGCPKDFTPFKDFVANKKEEASSEVSKITYSLNQLIKQMADVEAEGVKAEDEREALIQKAEASNRKNMELQKQITELEKDRNNRLNAKEKRENQISLLEEEKTRLVNQPADPIGDLDIMEKQATGIRSQINELKQSIQEKEKAKQTMLLLQQSMIDNRKSEYKAISLKAIQESLGPKGIQGELVKEILEPIKTDIQDKLKLMGYNHEPFFQTESDTGKEIFQFGWINERGHYVNFDALSTGQQTVFLAAMMMTIIDRAQPKLKLLIMDNLNHLDKTNFQLLVNGLTKLSDKLDNIILAGAIEFDFTADGWKVWDLSTEIKEEKSHEQIA